MTNPNLYTVGGTVQAGGGIYIRRMRRCCGFVGSGCLHMC
jgi:hypothetical protein